MLKEKRTQIFTYLLDSSSKASALYILSKLLNKRIAFNAPHKLAITKLEKLHVIVSLPLITANTNHLGSVHACAMATMGEYPAGLVLIKNFGFDKYRLIMKDLKIEFYKQATTNLTAEIKIQKSLIPELKDRLMIEHWAQVELKTSILNDQSELVAEVKTNWHLKNWKSVKFKTS